MPNPNTILTELWKDGFRAGADDVQCNRITDIQYSLIELEEFIEKFKKTPTESNDEAEYYCNVYNLAIDDVLKAIKSNE